LACKKPRYLLEFSPMRAKDTSDDVASIADRLLVSKRYFGGRCPKMTNPAGPNFIQRQLDAASALGEVLFGLSMVLTITQPARLTTAEDRDGAAILLGS
jgi:hypothetical protein